jgi:hypothetical protein
LTDKLNFEPTIAKYGKLQTYQENSKYPNKFKIYPAPKNLSAGAG